MNLSIGLSLTRPSGPLGFNPASLFANGEVGAWYDPSDSSTVFQDAAGTTPAGVGDPVGLILDKSQGLTLGSELEDTANTVAGWAPQGTNTVELDGDAIKIAFVDNSNGAQIALTAAGVLTTDLTAGKTYRLTAQAKVSAGGTVNAHIISATTNPAVSVTWTDFDTLTLNFVADGSNETFRAGSMNTGEVFWIKNISIRELPGNHATQSTPTARPTLQTSGGLYYLDFDGVDDFLRTATFASAQAQPNTISAALKDDSGTSTIYAWDGIVQRHILAAVSNDMRMYGSLTFIAASNARDILDNVYTAYYNTTSSDLRKNGTSVASGNVGTNTWDGISLGSNISSSNVWNGRIYGFIGVNRTLTAGEIDGVESYLAAKSGVTL